jgi:formate dehydrogenase iron-sulfur subunit
VTDLAAGNSKTFIDELLEEQKLLTAVTRFAQKHEDAKAPLQSRFYRDLLPLATPRDGEQYAFEVDLDKCSGCKACVAACHSLNGLESDESWRSVGLLVSDEVAAPFQQTVTTACHHCVDPACLNGCPVLAYEKDSRTGIVRHLDDQCIGCQYCVLKCPYEVPRYSSRLGIVRKCDMCANRLGAGEAPACVQSCPSAAIKITIVSKDVVREEHSKTENTFLPESPDAAYTIPTTRYISSKGLPAPLRAGDESSILPSAPHWPLVWMLALTQAGIGGIWVEWWNTSVQHTASLGLRISSAVLILSGLAAAVLHLGRPLQAWRAFIGVRRSWLSREIMAFNVLLLGVLLLLSLEVLPVISLNRFEQAALAFCSLAGAASLFSSIMVYVDTPREFWSWSKTVPRFLGTTLLLGAGLGTVFAPSTGFLSLVFAVGFAKLVHELSLFRHLSPNGRTALKRSAKLMLAELARPSLFRFGTLGLVCVSAAAFSFFHTDVSIWISVPPAAGCVSR